MSREMNRRAILAGTAAVVPAAAVASIPALAEADPAFAVVARARATFDAMVLAYQAAKDADIPEADAHDDAYYDLIETVPTTIEGLAAVVAFLAYASEDDFPLLRGDEDTVVFIKTLDEALRRMTGVTS